MIGMLLLVILGCLVIGLFAFIGGITASMWIAYYYPKPILFLVLGALIYILIYLAGSKILLKRIKNSKKNLYKITVFSIGFILITTLSLGMLLPIPDERKEPGFVKGQQFWDLASGSRIAYVHLQSNTNTALPPVIFLHGGPGVPDMSGDASFFGQLTQDGYDVYIYNQVGSGRSSRLKDPRGYTVERDVEDLELIRQKIGAEKVILIGHSYGGEIAAHYMAAYEGHVEKVVFASPGAINPQDKSDANLTKRLTEGEKRTLFKALLRPRVMMAYGLLQVNPAAAINFAGDDEMDGRFDRVYKYTLPALHSRGAAIGSELSGLGFYANQTPQSKVSETKPDIRSALRENNTPALIIKASSDYLSWSSGMDYKKSLTNSFLVYFSGAGHNVYQDKPKEFIDVLRAFLKGRPLPVAPYTKLEPPADYEGVY